MLTLRIGVEKAHFTHYCKKKKKLFTNFEGNKLEKETILDEVRIRNA